MNDFHKSDLTELLADHAGPCVSIYLSTHPTGPMAEQDEVRLKNLTTEAIERLTQQGVRAPVARDMLVPAQELPHDQPFWQHRGEGLAIFVAEGCFAKYRVPVAFEAGVTVANRFVIRPLVPLLHAGHSFYVLQLSQKRAALYAGNDRTLRELDAKLPPAMTTALDYDGADRGAQMHSGSANVGTRQGWVFHGQGGEPDQHKDDLLNYCRLVDAAVTAHLGKQSTPLLLACVDYVAEIYRHANHYPGLAEATIVGNTDYDSLSTLHERALDVIKRQIADPAVVQAVARFSDHYGTSRTSDDPQAILIVACEGRVSVLFCDPHVVLRSEDPADAAAATHDGLDLIDATIVVIL